MMAGGDEESSSGGGKRKRETKSHSNKGKHNRKKAKGGGRIGETNDSENELEIDILPLVVGSNNKEETKADMSLIKRIRVVRPYPFAFSTFSKARWIGVSILDVYHKEFGSYPRSYYESAINEGRILVSGNKVSCDYKVKGGDELSHSVHRHEPAVAVSDGSLPSSSADGKESSITPLITVLHQDENVIVVDKPSTLPIHPCGGYNFNSLLNILIRQDPSLKGRLYTVHRLDRLTSGLTIIAKNKNTAKKLGQCIKDRDHCHKVYLARVKGKFPLGAERLSEKRLSWPADSKPCQYGEDADGKPLLGYWIADSNGNVQQDATLNDVFESKRSHGELLHELHAEDRNQIGQQEGSKTKLWFHFACPCRIASHKNGVCEAGEFLGLSDEIREKTVKSAQTRFAVIEYDERSDSTVVLVKPCTGRTHQIRLHCQYLQHPIANDPNYGGELWYDNPAAKLACKEARKEMDEMDRAQQTSITAVDRPYDALSTDVPATEAELIDAAATWSREEGESMLDFIKKTCVWCARSRGGHRTMLEFLVRSRGIWLHALRYSLVIDTDGQTQMLSFQTDPPSWASFEQ